jgi:hypothetical protein
MRVFSPMKCVRMQDARALFAISTFAIAMIANPTDEGLVQAAEPTREELDKARERFLAAEEAERRGNYQVALQGFQKVYETRPSASVRFHLGFCNESLGRMASALAHYRDARDVSLKEGKAEAAKAASDAILRITPKLSYVIITSSEPCPITMDGIVLDGVKFGEAYPLDAGPHRIVCKPKAFAAQQEDVTLQEGEERRVPFAFSSTVVAKTTRMGPNTSTSTGSARTGLLIDNAPIDEKPGIAAPLVTTASTALVLGFSLFSFLRAGAIQGNAETSCLREGTCLDDRASVRLFDTMSLGGMLTSVALAGISTFLWYRYLTYSPPKVADAHGVRFTFTPPSHHGVPR